jgi:hypothetical protein
MRRRGRPGGKRRGNPDYGGGAADPKIDESRGVIDLQGLPVCPRASRVATASTVVPIVPRAREPQPLGGRRRTSFPEQRRADDHTQITQVF